MFSPKVDTAVHFVNILEKRVAPLLKPLQKKFVMVPLYKLLARNVKQVQNLPLIIIFDINAK